MKAEVIAALEYPRQLIGYHLNFKHCAQGGMYSERHAECIDCGDQRECQWLDAHDGTQSMSRHSLRSLIRDLAYSLEYVDERIARDKHNVGLCDCESCNWLRVAEQLYNRACRTNEPLI